MTAITKFETNGDKPMTKLKTFTDMLAREGYSYEVDYGRVIITHDGDVWMFDITTLDVPAYFNNEGNVYLPSLTTLAADTQFNNDGNVYLANLTPPPALPQFNNKGTAYLKGLTIPMSNNGDKPTTKLKTFTATEAPAAPLFLCSVNTVKHGWVSEDRALCTDKNPHGLYEWDELLELAATEDGDFALSGIIEVSVAMLQGGRYSFVTQDFIEEASAIWASKQDEDTAPPAWMDDDITRRTIAAALREHHDHMQHINSYRRA